MATQLLDRIRRKSPLQQRINPPVNPAINPMAHERGLPTDLLSPRVQDALNPYAPSRRGQTLAGSQMTRDAMTGARRATTQGVGAENVSGTLPYQYYMNEMQPVMAAQGERLQALPQTPRQQAQAWSDANIQSAAALPGAEQQQQPINMFGGGAHLDTSFVVNGRTPENQTEYDTWRTMTKDAARTIDEALARRGNIPRTMDEAQAFVRSMPFDDRLGEFVEQHITGYIKKANPELYKEITERARAKSANEESFAEWYRQYSGDPEALRMTPAQIAAAKTPELEYQFDTDPRSVRWGYNPATQRMEQVPPRQLSRDELLAQKRQERDYQRREQLRTALIKNAETLYEKQLDKINDTPPKPDDPTYAGYQADLAAAFNAHQERLTRIDQQYGEDAGQTGATTPAGAPATTPAAFTPPPPGTVEDGFVFKGGDPKDPASWQPAPGAAPQQQPGRGAIRLPTGEVVTAEMVRPKAAAPAPLPTATPAPTPTPAAATEEPAKPQAAGGITPLPETDLTDVVDLLNKRRAAGWGPSAALDSRGKQLTSTPLTQEGYIKEFGQEKFDEMVNQMFDEMVKAVKTGKPVAWRKKSA